MITSLVIGTIAFVMGITIITLWCCCSSSETSENCECCHVEKPVVNGTKPGLMELTETWGGFKRGARYLATIKDIRTEGVHVHMPDGKGVGVIGARCLGNGNARKKAMAKLSVGDRIEVVVRSYHADSLTLLLDLAGNEEVSTKMVKRNMSKNRGHKQVKAHQRKEMTTKRHKTTKKPAYRLIPEGTTFLFDTANVVGALGPQQAARKLGAIEAALAKFGHKAAFFIEERTLTWLRRNQENEADVSALNDFSRKTNVSKVGGEADLPILQVARQIPDSVIVSLDHFADYQETYSEIVGSDRHCSYSVTQIEDKTLFMIRGLRDAIVIEDWIPLTTDCKMVDFLSTPETVKSSGLKAVDGALFRHEDSPAILHKQAFPPVDSRKGILGVGDACRMRGAMKRAIACYSRVARKNPTVYFEIADIYANSDDGYNDNRTALKYERLGEYNERRIRQCAMRRARLMAENRRVGYYMSSWMRAA